MWPSRRGGLEPRNPQDTFLGRLLKHPYRHRPLQTGRSPAPHLGRSGRQWRCPAGWGEGESEGHMKRGGGQGGWEGGRAGGCLKGGTSLGLPGVGGVLPHSLESGC